MALKTKTVNSNLVVYLSGRMDVHLSAEVEKDLNDIIAQNKDFNLILNLRNVEYMSSSGLRIFVAVMRQLKENGRALKLVEMNHAVQKVFEVVELMDMFDIFPTEEAALA